MRLQAEIVNPDGQTNRILAELHRSGWLGEQAAQLAGACESIWEAKFGGGGEPETETQPPEPEPTAG